MSPFLFLPLFLLSVVFLEEFRFRKPQEQFLPSGSTYGIPCFVGLVEAQPCGAR